MGKDQQAEGNRIAGCSFYGALVILALFAVYAVFMSDAGQLLINASRAPGTFSR